MFLDGAPLPGVAGSGSADVQAGLRQTLRAVLDMQVQLRCWWVFPAGAVHCSV